jgi:predicted GNAT superfamily acetyltransferase
LGDSPWASAHAAAAAAGVSLRPLTSIRDADGVLEVMIATWGNHQLLPREMIVALGESGNAPFGAFDDEDRLVGYVLGWAGVDTGGPHIHSHMLAALPDRRYHGIGTALKLAQRAQALEQGVHVVRWTFDPMVARNAWVNLGKLGAVADRFRRDFYGAMTDSLNDGERSDRLVVRWDLDREPGPRPAPDDAATVTVPRDYSELRERDPEAARAARDETAAALESQLGGDRVVVAFDRDRSAYLLAEEPGALRRSMTDEAGR